MQKLSTTTIKLISSSQVITSVYAAVKELVENSIDAQATSIEIRLDNFGLKRIEVVDNGCGIPEGEEEFVAKPHFTSKLKDHKDLATLSTLGFRGEALFSLCSVSNLSFSTKTESQSVGELFTLDNNGSIIDRKPCTRQNGVTIISDNLFKNLPVRKQFYSRSKKGKEELKKVQDLLIAYGLIMPELRITLKHNQSIIWQKFKSSSLKDSFISTFGLSCYREMQQGNFEIQNCSLKIAYVLPKACATEEICRKSNDRIFMFINKRPVMLKNICQVVKSCCNEFVPVLQSKYPIAFLAMDLPTTHLDVNVEPNKSVVLIKNVEEIKELIQWNICSVYKEQSLSKKDDSSSIGLDARGYNDSTSEQDSSDVMHETESNRHHDTTQHIRSSRMSDENSSLCKLTSLNDLFDLAGESFHPATPQDIHTNHCCNTFDETHVEGGKIPKIPRLELEKTGDYLMQENMSPGKSYYPQTKEKSVFDKGPQNPGLEPPQSSSLNGYFEHALPIKLPQVAEGKLSTPNNVGNFGMCSEECGDDIDGIVLGSNEELNKDINRIEAKSNITARNDDINTFSNSPSDKVENNDKTGPGNFLARSNGDERSTSAKQLTVDEWSHGIAIIDKNNGDHLQPFRILESEKSCVAKKQFAKKGTKREKSNITANAGFVQTALPRKYSEESIVSFNLSDVKHHFEDMMHCGIESVWNTKLIDVIGEISPWKSWIIRLENKLYFFNPLRAYEGELFDELMKKHVLPSELLQESISITESLLKKSSIHGSRNWEFLHKMSFERSIVGSGRCLVDDRITSNGIEVRKRKDINSNEATFEIVKLCTDIENYGISDLNEIFDKIHEFSGNKNTLSFEKFRPQKVADYFRREAVRLVRSSTTTFTKDEINDLALKMISQTERYDNILCLHEKPVFSHINTMSL